MTYGMASSGFKGNPRDVAEMEYLIRKWVSIQMRDVSVYVCIEALIARDEWWIIKGGYLLVEACQVVIHAIPLPKCITMALTDLIFHNLSWKQMLSIEFEPQKMSRQAVPFFTVPCRKSSPVLSSPLVLPATRMSPMMRLMHYRSVTSNLHDAWSRRGPGLVGARGRLGQN